VGLVLADPGKPSAPAAFTPILLNEKAQAIDPKHRGSHEYRGGAFLVLGDLLKAKEHLAILDQLCFFPWPGVLRLDMGAKGPVTFAREC